MVIFQAELATIFPSSSVSPVAHLAVIIANFVASGALLLWINFSVRASHKQAQAELEERRRTENILRTSAETIRA
ncbi:MAG: hypothetical protein FJZ96_09965 [Chloroflexi bacterium]|nr:hypothetical protein [Chloroflexota bacterium]